MVRGSFALLVALVGGCTGNPGFMLAPDGEDVGTGTGSTTEVAGGTDGATSSAGPATTSPDPTTGAPAVCGDGEVGGAEECDDGVDNGDDRACTADCRLAVCGDGLLRAGEEACDAGANNGDDAHCTSQCQVAVCGDGLVRTQGDDPEGCDDGAANNAWALGACPPGCARRIPSEMLTIYMSPAKVLGNLTTVNNMEGGGVATGDANCDELLMKDGLKAMVADGVLRQATIEPWVGGEQGIDWVLHPYQGYQNQNELFLGITGREALLGVQDGNFTGPLAAPLGPQQAVRTGMLSDWTVTVDDCVDWMVLGGGPPYATVGNAAFPDMYLDGAGKANCLDPLPVYCVEQ